MNGTSPKSKIDELQKQLETAEEDAKKVDILNKLSDLLLNSEPEKAMKYAAEALELSEAIGFKNGIADSLNNIGIIYNDRGDYPQALEYYHKSLEIREELSDEKGIADCLMDIGISYYFQGDYPRALKYYHQSLKIDEELGYKKGIAGCLHSIGRIHSAQGIYSQALKCYQQALEINEEIGNKQWICFNLNSIGIVYRNQGDYPKALECYHKSLEIREELDDKKGIAYYLNNIGIIYKKQGDYLKALEYYHKSLKIKEEVSDREGIVNSYNNIGKLYMELGEMQKSIEYLIKGLNLAQKIGAPNREMAAYMGLSETYEKMNDHAKALEYYKLFKETNDRLFGQEQTKKIAQLESRLELEKKEQEIEIWRQASVTDSLTKLLNRQGLWDKIRDEINRFSRNKKPFVLSIADIDSFKLFNDEHGHDCGDSVLVAVANILKTTTRAQDHVGRWGGEEFLMLLPETDLNGGLEVIEKVRYNIEVYSHNHNGKNHSITVSFGLSEYRGDKNITASIKEADEALYSAKMKGKNCCEVAG